MIIIFYVKFGFIYQGYVQEICKFQEVVSGCYDMGNIIGRSEVIIGVFELVRIVVDVDWIVLIIGESGLGKELIVNVIYYNGWCKIVFFIVVDCLGFFEYFFESELFGYFKGVFIGVGNDKMGVFEEVSGGMIFFDEIKDVFRSLQQKLCRVLQEGEIWWVGENIVCKVDVWVICVINEDFGEWVQFGDFIQDFYYRVNKFFIYVFFLKEWCEDILLLVVYFFCLMDQVELQDSFIEISLDVMEVLVYYDWSKNNIRQFCNIVELV